jgi:hypothetical protein
MTVLSPSLLTSAVAARVSLGATRPMAKEREEKRKHEVSCFDETRAGGGDPLLKSVPVHAIDLRQIEPSYKVRLLWDYIQRFIKGGRRIVGRLSRRNPRPLCRSGLVKSCWRASARLWPRHSNSNRNETRAAAESGFEEKYLSSIKRRKLLRHLNRQSKRNS